MRIKKTESDLDFIGGLGSLTAEEEKALSAYFKKKKTNSKSLGDHKKSRETKVRAGLAPARLAPAQASAHHVKATSRGRD